jgi:hypothetical protein
MFQRIKPVMLTHFDLTNPKRIPTLDSERFFSFYECIH